MYLGPLACGFNCRLEAFHCGLKVSCVSLQVLFLKNLHPRVSEDDLLAVFGLFRTGVKCPRVRVLVGRMRGQAFVEFDGKDIIQHGEGEY